jgi:hypothetical protein
MSKMRKWLAVVMMVLASVPSVQAAESMPEDQVGVEEMSIGSSDTLTNETKENVYISFRDVPEKHWAYSDVMAGVQKGYINGLPNGKFAPDQTVSRAEFIKMAVAALGLPIEQHPDEAWYVPYARAALEHGLIDPAEYEDGDYTRFMSRMEMVRVAVKAIDESTRNAGLLDEELMLKAVENGIIRGINGKTVPQGTSTRAQAVTVIERMLKVRDGGELPVDEEVLEIARIEYRIAIGDIWEDRGGYFVIYNDIASYFEMKLLDSIYIEDGHLKGYLPVTPEGTEYHMGFQVWYDPKDKVVASSTGVQLLITASTKLTPGEYFSLPIKAVDKAKEIKLSVTFENAVMPSNRRTTIMYYLDNKRIVEIINY